MCPGTISPTQRQGLTYGLVTAHPARRPARGHTQPSHNGTHRTSAASHFALPQSSKATGQEPTPPSSSCTDSLGAPRHMPHPTLWLPAGVLAMPVQSPAADSSLGLPRTRLPFRGMQPRSHSTACWLAEGAAPGPNSTNPSFLSLPLQKNYPEAQRLLFKC